MAKIDSKELVKRIKNKEKPDRANVTFRLDSTLMSDFKKTCEAQAIKPTAALEELMMTFIKDLKSR